MLQVVMILRNLEKRIISYATRASEKIRSDKLQAKKITVFIRTNKFNKKYNSYSGFKTYDFISPTNDLFEIIKVAVNALQKIYHPQHIDLPKLVDYAVRIPPGSNSDALCETTITWKSDAKEFTTRGLDSDQTVAAIKATEKMLNIIQN